MTRKLVVAMVIIGFVLSAMTTVELGFYLAVSAQKNVDQTQKANETAVKTNAKLAADVAAGTLPAAEAAKSKATITKITWYTRSSWIITTGVVGGFCFLLVIVAALMVLGRDESLPMTWAEAIIYTGITFWFLIVINGIIPHYMITIWDSILQPPSGLDLKDPMTVVLTKQIAGVWHSVTGNTSPALGWQWSWQTLRDIIVAGWYVVTLVATVAGFWWVQEFIKRGKAQEAATSEGKAALKSPYGRPMLVTGK